MSKSSSEILREYAKIISEAMDDATGFSSDLPDESMMDDDKGNDMPEEQVSNGDPVSELAKFLDENDLLNGNKSFSELISEFLKSKNLEITPIGGVSNSEGQV